MSSPDIRTAGNSQGWALVCLAALPTMAMVSLVPVLPLLFKVFAGVPRAEWYVPMVMTIPSLCIATCSPLMGALADRYGRRPVLVTSLLAFTVVGVLPTISNGLMALLATRLAVGVAEAGIMTTQNALMGDYFRDEARQRWLGIFSLTAPIYGACFIVAGGALGSISWRAPFFLYLLGIPVALWIYRSAYEPERAKPPIGDAVASGGFWHAVLVVAPVTLVISLLIFVQGLQLGRVFAVQGVDSSARIGLLVTAVSAGVVAGGWFYTHISRLSVTLRFSLTLICFAMGYAGLGLAPSLAWAIPSALVCQFANGLAVPVLLGWSHGKFNADNRGRGMGVWSSSFFFGNFLSAPVVTVLQRAFGSYLAAISAVGALASLLVSATIVVAMLRKKANGLAEDA